MDGDAAVLAIPITTYQATALLRELGTQADALRDVVAADALVGSREQLVAAAKAIDAAHATAAALGQAARAGKMEKLLAKLSAAGIDAYERIERSTQPERKPKQIHHAKLNRTWYTVETLRKGRAQGVGRRNGGQRQRVSTGETALMRGDRIFWHGSPARPNDIRSYALLAGTFPGEGAEALASHRAALRRLATANAKQKLPARIAAAYELLSLRPGGEHVRPSDVSRLLVRDDLRAKRYPFRGSKHRAAAKRYTKHARVFIARQPDVRRVEQGIPDAKAHRAIKRQARKRVVPIATCEHDEFRVSAKRTRRTCERCGHVDVKRNGRWTVRRQKAVVVTERPPREQQIARLMQAFNLSREEAARRVKKLEVLAA